MLFTKWQKAEWILEEGEKGGVDISSGGKRLSGVVEWWLLAEWIIREVENVESAEKFHIPQNKS